MADNRITIRLECDVTPAERVIGKSHSVMVEAVARLEERRREQNRRAVAWWRSQRPEVAYGNLGELAGRRNGKSWVCRSREDTAAGTPNQGGGGS